MVASIALPHIVGDMIGGTAITLTTLHELLTTSGADEKNGNDNSEVVDSDATMGEYTVRGSSQQSRLTETSSMPGVAVDNEVDN